MKSFGLFSRSFLILSLLPVAAGSFSQENKADADFLPQVGQKGKDVVWVPTPQELVDTMLSMAKVTPEDYVIDLGSGDGRTVISAAKRGAHALGIEYNPDMVALSKNNAANEGVTGKVEFIQADLYECDLSKATVITMFLLPEINLKLRPRLLDLKPGTRIVSNTFTMGEWDPDYEVTTKENWNSWCTALLWYVPAKVEGIWKLGDSELYINQKFQMIYGRLINSDKSSNISGGRLRGEEITFVINGAVYLGHVKGNVMIGTVTTADSKSDWVATLKDS
jgi:precorrin-6B methylase 2